MSNDKWFRFPADAIHAQTIRELPLELFRAWVDCMTVTRQRMDAPFTAENLAFAARVTATEANAHIEALTEKGLLECVDGGYLPANWKQTQYNDPGSADRSKRYRQNRRSPGNQG